MTFEQQITTTCSFFRWLKPSPYEQIDINENEYKEYCKDEKIDFLEEDFNFLKDIKFIMFKEEGHGETQLVYYSQMYDQYFCILGWYDSWDADDFFQEVFEIKCEIIPVRKFSANNTILYLE